MIENVLWTEPKPKWADYASKVFSCSIGLHHIEKVNQEHFTFKHVQ